jgi:hypothetical protein
MKEFNEGNSNKQTWSLIDFDTKEFERDIKSVFEGQIKYLLNK